MWTCNLLQIDICSTSIANIDNSRLLQFANHIILFSLWVLVIFMTIDWVIFLGHPETSNHRLTKELFPSRDSASLERSLHYLHLTHRVCTFKSNRVIHDQETYFRFLITWVDHSPCMFNNALFSHETQGQGINQSELTARYFQ